MALSKPKTPETPELYTPTEIENRLNANGRLCRVEVELAPAAMETAIAFLLERADAVVHLKNDIFLYVDNWAWNHDDVWIRDRDRKPFEHWDKADGEVRDAIFDCDNPDFEKALSYIMFIGIKKADANTSSGRSFILEGSSFTADFGYYGSNNFAYGLLPLLKLNGDACAAEWITEEEVDTYSDTAARNSIKRTLATGKPNQQDILNSAASEHGDI